jgi:hypothetical protein
VFDISDHTLTQISTWAEVAILLFMVWEHYGPRLWTNAMTAVTKSRHQGFQSSLWENRTIIVAIIGLAIVVWLHWGRAATSSTDGEAQKSTLIEWLTEAQKERDQAIAERKSAQNGWAADRLTIEAMQSQSGKAQRLLDEAKKESDQLRKQLQSRQPAETRETLCVDLARQLLQGKGRQMAV